MKSFAFIESFWIFRHGLCSRIRNISYRRQSDLPEHVLRMWNIIDVIVLDGCWLWLWLNIDPERPKTRGWPPKHYHPLLEKEKHVGNVIRKILPKPVADTLCPTGSRLAHLCGLPKTHKPTLSMRPILSATKTYNYDLAKWLEEKLKPLSINEHTITDTFKFAV